MKKYILKKFRKILRKIPVSRYLFLLTLQASHLWRLLLYFKKDCYDNLKRTKSRTERFMSHLIILFSFTPTMFVLLLESWCT